MCPSIKPECVLSVVDEVDNIPRVPPDFEDGNDLNKNEIYIFTVDMLGMERIDCLSPDFNFTPISTIQMIVDQVKLGAVEILFLDFDKTLQIHNMAIPFHQIVEVLDPFSKKIRINEFAPLLQ